MKLPKKTQVLLFSALAAFTATLFVSDTRIKRNPKKLLEKAVGETAEKWRNRLSLTKEQAEQLRKKLIESAYRKTDVVQSRLQKAEKDARMRELNEQENQELRVIFTEPQYDLYIYILKEEQKA